jgi:hypothetical protein
MLRDGILGVLRDTGYVASAWLKDGYRTLRDGCRVYCVTQSTGTLLNRKMGMLRDIMDVDTAWHDSTHVA